MNRNGPCWCNSGEKWKNCHYPISFQLDWKSLALQYEKHFGIILKTEVQIQGIRNACKIAATILKKICQAAVAGVTTNALNDLANALHREAGAIPAALHYGSPPFPKSICTSLNEVICHGIPDDNPLLDGDIVNIDVASVVDGYYGDCSAMVLIGQVDAEKQLVVEVAHECLMQAIAILKPGILLSKIGEVIESYATSHRCSVVRQFVAHGVGLHFHEQPQIPHHRNKLHIPLVSGMTFTIEPMINAGVASGIVDTVDQWTTRTSDGKPSAQWEHTVLITHKGAEVLTQL